MPKLNPDKKPTTIAPILLSTKQAAEALQVSERTIFSLLAEGRLPSVRIGSSRRIRTQDLERFAAAGLQREDAARSIYLHQRDEINAFSDEWLAAEKSEAWMKVNAENIDLIIVAYKGEINRLLSNRPLTPERNAVLDAGLPVAKRVQSRLKEHVSELPLSDPKSLADRAYSFVVSAGYQFAASLGSAQKPDQIVEHAE